MKINFTPEVRMDRSSLVIEKPALTQAVLDETDGLLNEVNRELADYAATHLGYWKLSGRLAQEKNERDQKVAVAAQTNNLATALQKADINVYAEKSVKKYQEMMVRHGWLKILLSPSESGIFSLLFFLVPILAATAYLAGWMSGLSAIVLTVLFSLPCTKEIWRSFKQEDSVGFGIFFVILTIAPLGGLVIAFATQQGGWTIPTYIVGLFGFWCSLEEFIKQLKKSRVYWNRVPIGDYREEIPLFALSKMKQIHELCPSTKFSIEELKADIYLPDPFLVATDSVTGKDFYIEVWDEPKFEAKYA